MVAALALAACDETQQSAGTAAPGPTRAAAPAGQGGAAAVDAVAQATARAVVRTALERRFPQVPPERVTPYTDCIIGNASAGEIVALAGDAKTGVDAGTVRLVLAVSGRPDTLTCLASAEAPAAA